MYLRNKMGVCTALLAVNSLVFIANCTADEMVPQTPRQIRRAEAANRVPPQVTAMARANTISYEYYQSSIAQRAETKRQIHSQPHPSLFTKMSLAHQQTRRDFQNAGSYPIEWFCYIKGNGVAVWDHRP